jgi:hypothetical protein
MTIEKLRLHLLEAYDRGFVDSAKRPDEVGMLVQR